MRNIRIVVSVLFFLLVLGNAFAQTPKEEIFKNPNKAAGTYFAYPENEVQDVMTPAPAGYAPFYISHFGRHGSRYLNNEESYTEVLDVLNTAANAGALSESGEALLRKMRLIWEEAEGRPGELSPLGVKQQRGIAERLFENYPSLFSDDVPIKAFSTLVPRCILSMDAFCERLKELNPTLSIKREASMRNLGFLNYKSEASSDFWHSDQAWKQELKALESSTLNPSFTIDAVFSDKAYVKENIHAIKFMKSLYGVASILQNMEIDASIFEYFDKEQLFLLWNHKNIQYYINDGPSAISIKLNQGNAKPLLLHIIEEAQQAISSQQPELLFKFAHDANLMPLSALMGLENCSKSIHDMAGIHEAWQNYYVSPMAGNIQLVFFRNADADIIVKILHNEKETAVEGLDSAVFPFYKWSELKSYFEGRINKL